MKTFAACVGARSRGTQGVLRVIAFQLIVCSLSFGQTATPHVPRVKDFPSELAKNFGALFSRDNLIPFAGGAVLTGASAIPEQNVEAYFLNHPEQIESYTEPGEILGNEYILAPVIGGLFVTGRYVGDDRFRSMSYALTQGFLVNGAVTSSMKYAIGRRRPNDADNLSFPSGHTSTSFMWATVLSRTYGAKVGIPAYITATYIGATRLEENAHHLTDVFAGATIGYIVGRTVTRHRKNDKPRRVTWMVSPVSRGFVASFSLPGPR